MKIGQMSLNKVSEKADYLQLDICGKSPSEALDRYLNYKPENLPIILHGDWTKKGSSENNLESRIDDYLNIIELLKSKSKVIGFTIHPPARRVMPLAKFISICDYIESKIKVNFFIENRSSSSLLVSKPDEIIALSYEHLMTIDLPQLYISSGYNEVLFEDVIRKINWNNVSELHLANLKRDGSRTYVARKFNDGIINYSNIINYVSEVEYATLEILGGVNTFNNEKECLIELLNNSK